jgi:hypothetical protein
MTRRFPLLAVAALSSLVSIMPLAGGADASEPGSRLFLTGGGWIGDPDRKLTFGLRLSCPSIASPPDVPGPDAMELGFQGGSRFHLQTVDSAGCATTDPDSGGIYRGTGSGECNGQPAIARFVFRAAPRSGLEEPSAAIQVSSADPSCDVFEAFQPLGSGNIRFHATG